MGTLFTLFAALMTDIFVAHTSIDVLTFNVYAKPDPTNIRYTNERMEQICEVLKSGPWDVVMLQEVWTSGNRKRFRNCGYAHVMDLNRTGENDTEGNLGSGLMILSRFPLQQSHRLILSRPSFNWASVTHGEILVGKSVYLTQAELPNGKNVWFANTHLVANYCKSVVYSDCDSYDVERLKQMTEAAQFVNSRTSGKSLVFAGDFNSGPHPFRNDSSWRNWEDLFPGLRQAPYDTANTCTSCGSNFFKATDSGKIDHIFASSDLIPSNGKVVLDSVFTSRDDGEKLNLSDHYAWETRIDFGSN